MTIPLDLVMVSHGESEHDLVLRAVKNGDAVPANASAVRGRRDDQQRLSPEGRRQAAETGEWLWSNGLDLVAFDLCLVSPFLRTLETAAILAPDASWLPSRLVVERDLGSFSTYADPAFDAGGTAFDISFQVESLLGSLDHADDGRQVAVVCHDGLMWAMRAVLEMLLPDEWQALAFDPSVRMAPGCVLHYTRTCPFGTGDVAESLSSGWRRMTDPTSPEMSPYGGDWVRLLPRRRLVATGIAALLDASPSLL